MKKIIPVVAFAAVCLSGFAWSQKGPSKRVEPAVRVQSSEQVQPIREIEFEPDVIVAFAPDADEGEGQP